MTHSLSKVQSWREHIKGQDYCVSTLASSLNLDFVNDAFATDDMYWAKRLPIDHLETLVSHSINLGLYRVQPAAPRPATPSQPSSPPAPSQKVEDEAHEILQQVGFARIATDFVTTAYITDVYVDPDCRGLGLGQWLVSCCNIALTTLPALRNVMLVASPNGVEFYAKHLGVRDIKGDEGVTILHRPQWQLEDVQ